MVNATRAGDAFVRALLCKIVDDRSILKDEGRLRKVLKFANACGAITTTKKGANPTFPTEPDVLSLIEGGGSCNYRKMMRIGVCLVLPVIPILLGINCHGVHG